MQEGQSRIEVKVESEEYGQKNNVTAGQITQIITTIPGVNEVTNYETWLEQEGTDQETDEELQARYFLRWRENNGSTKYAYESWAMGVAGINSVKVLDQHPRGQGTVDVVVRGTAGIPTQSLLFAVSEVMEKNRPVNDDVKVISPAAVDVEIDAQLEIVEGSPEDIMRIAQNNIRAFFEAIRIGQDITHDKLVKVMMSENLKKINFVKPETDMAIGRDGLAVLKSIRLTYKMVEA